MSQYLHLKKYLNSMDASNKKRTLPLFREEAMAYNGRAEFGEVGVAHDRLFRYITIAATCLFVGVLAIVASLNYSKKVLLPGAIVPLAGEVQVLSPEAGRVVVQAATQGEPVKRGQVLFELAYGGDTRSGEDPHMRVSEILSERRASLAATAAAQSTEQKERRSALESRLVRLRHGREQLNSQIAFQRRRVDISKAGVDRMARLEKDGFVSLAAIPEKEAELIDQQQRLAELERLASTADAEIVEVESDVRGLALRAVMDQAVNRREELVAARELVDNEIKGGSKIRAPADGVLATVNLNVGQMVAANALMASIVSGRSDFVAALYAPSQAAQQIRAGMSVVVRVKSHEMTEQSRALTGEVLDVSDVPVRPSESGISLESDPSFSMGDARYRVRVKLVEVPQSIADKSFLRSGMSADGYVVIGERRVYEWILAPFVKAMGRIS